MLDILCYQFIQQQCTCTNSATALVVDTLNREVSSIISRVIMYSYFTSRIAIRCPLFTTNTLINPLHTPSIVLCNSMDIISWHGRQVSTLEVKTSPRPYSRVSSTRRSRSATPSSVTFQCRHIYGNDFCLVYTAELEVMDRVGRTAL